MDSFLSKFFPSVYRLEENSASTSQYCKFDSQLLTLFTSSLYLAALIASFMAATVTRKHGRKWSMFIGGLTFLIGAVINGVAINVFMLILGRVLLGIGVGFCNQVRVDKMPRSHSNFCSITLVRQISTQIKKYLSKTNDN